MMRIAGYASVFGVADAGGDVVRAGAFEPGGTARVKTLAAAAEARVRALAGIDGGHRVAGVAFVRSFVLKDPDGWTQGVVEFRIRTEQL